VKRLIVYLKFRGFGEKILEEVSVNSVELEKNKEYTHIVRGERGTGGRKNEGMVWYGYIWALFVRRKGNSHRKEKASGLKFI